MNAMPCQVPCCSRCRHYTLEGRRGGHCSQLGVPVQGRWQACSVSMPVFLAPLPELSVLEMLPQPIEIHFPEPLVVLEGVVAQPDMVAHRPAKALAMAS